MLWWDYLKEYIEPRHPSKLNLTWGRLFPFRRQQPVEQNAPEPLKGRGVLARWFLREHHKQPHGALAWHRQAPRETHSTRTTPHR